VELHFLSKAKVIEYHTWLIERFGGSIGLRDEGALESALAAAPNRYHYEDANIVKCAAAYAYHLSQAHSFLDGNKRIAAAIMELFLNINRTILPASDDEIENLILGIASGRITRDESERVLSMWAAPEN
jgi:death-on-curing protein